MPYDPAKERAKRLLKRAIERGEIPRSSKCTCAHCGTNIQKDESVRIEYHHEDYSKPLEVIPLCCRCHTKVHVTKGQKFQNQSETAKKRWEDPQQRANLAERNSQRMIDNFNEGFKKG